MSKKVKFSLFLVVVGVITGLLVIFPYGMSGGSPALTLVFLSLAIVCIMAGSILAFSRLLDRMVTPLVEEVHKDIEDDLQDLKARRFTSTHVMVIMVVLSLVAFAFFVFRFHKVEAAWGPVPVIVPAFIGLLVLAYFIPRTRWFRFYRDRTPMWVFLIPVIGLVLSTWLGLAKAEDMHVLRQPATQPAVYNNVQPSGLFLQSAGNVSDFAFSFDLPDCDGDACGTIFLVIALIVLVLVLVIGSAYIPHFWILSGTILLGIMLLIAIHDLRLRPESPAALEDRPWKV